MTPFQALFNWLQIKVVHDARPEDDPARKTVEFFEQILREDHGIEIQEVHRDETMYTVIYLERGKPKKQMFDRESAEYLLESIRKEPKYGL